MSKKITDAQVVKALQDKHKEFVSQFGSDEDSVLWSPMDHVYFKHVCQVLDHAERIFKTDMDSLVDRKVNFTS